jgi:hypothetical protein
MYCRFYLRNIATIEGLIRIQITTQTVSFAWLQLISRSVQMIAWYSDGMFYFRISSLTGAWCNLLFPSQVTPCDHFFHSGCLQRWMDIKMECPTCRRPLPPAWTLSISRIGSTNITQLTNFGTSTSWHPSTPVEYSEVLGFDWCSNFWVLIRHTNSLIFPCYLRIL